MTEAASPSLLDRLRATDRDAAEPSYGQNRRIVLALRDDIEAALAAGYSLRRVFTLLCDDGSLTTDYSSFRRAARNIGIGGRARAAKPAAAKLTITPPGKPPFVFERPSDEPREFVHNPRPNRKDLL